MRLDPIPRDGIPEATVLPEIAREVCGMMIAFYQEHGYEEPWTGYLAFEGDECVGSCAFKTPPRERQVEIAYFTFPGNEGRGIATWMASQLAAIAFRQDLATTVIAQTLPEENASTRILSKLGFRMTGEIDHPEDGRVWQWELGGSA